MSQPQYAIEYLGALKATKNVPLASASVLTDFPTATVLKIKSKNVRVSVDNTVMFPVDYNDENYLVTGHTYTFSEDCVVAVGKYMVVT